MKKCEKCSHYHVCALATHIAKTNKSCSLFMNKTHIIELPFEIGNKAFIVKKGKIREGVITSCFIGRTYRIAMVADELNSVDIPVSFEKFGTSVFLSRNEAEKALTKSRNSAPT